MIVLLSILNIILSSLLVLSFDLNIFGVVLGTLIASYTTLIIFTLFTYNFIIKKFKIIPRFEKLIVKSKLLKLFNINLDIFIRTLFLTFSFLWVTYLGSKLGDDYLAVNTILMQFIILAAFFLDAYAFSTEGIVGYTIGRKNKKSFAPARWRLTLPQIVKKRSRRRGNTSPRPANATLRGRNGDPSGEGPRPPIARMHLGCT